MRQAFVPGFIWDEGFSFYKLLKKPSRCVLSRSDPSTYKAYASGPLLLAALPEGLFEQLVSEVKYDAHDQNFRYDLERR